MTPICPWERSSSRVCRQRLWGSTCSVGRLCLHAVQRVRLSLRLIAQKIRVEFRICEWALHDTYMSAHSARLVILSDTHELHREIEPIPPGDILLFAGDFSFFGQSWPAIRDFDQWLGDLPHAHKILVVGNHEVPVAANAEAARSMIRNGLVLWDEGAEAMGLRIWGVAPPFSASSLGASNAAEAYAAIPVDIDIVLSHHPPYGIQDAVPPFGHHAGSRELFDVVRRVRPRLHAFGHIHAGYGWFQSSPTTFVNASLMGPNGDLINRPIVLQMSKART